MEKRKVTSYIRALTKEILYEKNEKELSRTFGFVPSGGRTVAGQDLHAVILGHIVQAGVRALAKAGGPRGELYLAPP
eukprot:8528095-Pyramimonas_sp.AAC.2